MGVARYDTIDTLNGETVDSSVKAISTDGYMDQRDRGGWFAVRLNSAPSPIEAWHTTSVGSVDPVYWELRVAEVVPEMFGAKGDAQMDAAGTVTGTFDKPALDLARDYATTFGAKLRLISKYRYGDKEEYVHQGPIDIEGENRDETGIFIDIMPSIAGFRVLSRWFSFRNAFISVKSDDDITNGEGAENTCITFGRVYYSNPEKEVIIPEYVSGVLQNVRLLRRPGANGGIGHAACCAGRVSGVSFENIDCVGWPSINGYHGSFLLVHPGYNGDPFPLASEDWNVLIRPLILQVYDGGHSYHPNLISVRGCRCRYTGRLLNTSSSYNVSISDADIDGLDDTIGANGQQVWAADVGDEADALATSDDKGKVCHNLKMANVVGWNIDGASPNDAGTTLIDWPGASTSKYTNDDNSPAKGDITAFISLADMGLSSITIPPMSATPNYWEGDVTLPSTIADATGLTPVAFFSKENSFWYSPEPDDNAILKVEASFSPSAPDKIHVKIINQRAAARTISAGSPPNAFFNVAMSKKRREYQPSQSGCEMRNISLYTLGQTTYAMYLRNFNGNLVVDNVEFGGSGSSDAVSLSVVKGNITFRNCSMLGGVHLHEVVGVMFESCSVNAGKNFDVIFEEAPTGWKRGDKVVDQNGLGGVVYDVPTPLVKTLTIRCLESSGAVFAGTIHNLSTSSDQTIHSISSSDDAAFAISGAALAAMSLPTSTSVAAGAQSLTFASHIPTDIAPLDKVMYSGGTVTATTREDKTNNKINISRLPATATDSTPFNLDRRSLNVCLHNVMISGEKYGLLLDHAVVDMRGGSIRDTWTYGAYVTDSAELHIADVMFGNNGLTNVSLSTGASTRDLIAGPSSYALYADRCIFREGHYVANSVVINNAVQRGHVVDCSFVAPGEQGATVSAATLAVTNPLSNTGWFITANNRLTTNGTLINGGDRVGKATLPAGTIGTLVTQQYTVTVSDAAVGDQVLASLNIPLQGCVIWGEVTGAGTAVVYLYNPTAGGKTFAAGTITAVARRL